MGRPDATDTEVREAARTANIDNFINQLPDKYDTIIGEKGIKLSGGQRQRVALGRALIKEPKVLLMDEPLSNLDAELRHQMRAEIRRLHDELGCTTIYVTHDQIEAMTLADRIVVINQGIIEQVGTPIELYNSPKNQFVAEFIGSPKMNMIDLKDGDKLNFVNLKGPSEATKLGIRPEHLSLSDDGSCKLKGTVRHIENLGEHLLCYINLDENDEIVAKLDVNSKIKINENIRLEWHQNHQHFFDSSGVSID